MAGPAGPDPAPIISDQVSPPAGKPLPTPLFIVVLGHKVAVAHNNYYIIAKARFRYFISSKPSYNYGKQKFNWLRR